MTGSEGSHYGRELISILQQDRNMSDMGFPKGSGEPPYLHINQGLPHSRRLTYIQ